MVFTRLLALLLMLSAGTVHGQTPSTAIDSMLARVGTIVDAEEKDYFGLFPDVALSSFVDAAFEPMPQGELQLVIRTHQRTIDRRLDAETATLLARYVAHYEALRAPNLPPYLSTVARRVELGGLARHQLADASDAQVLFLPRSDGGLQRGWLLLVDDDYALLYDADTPFDIDRLDERLTAIPLAELSETVPVLRDEKGAFIEAGVGLAVQAGLAALGYTDRRDLSDPLVAGYTAGGAAVVVGGFRLLRSAQVDGVAPLSGPLLSDRVPREVRAWRNRLPIVAPDARAAPRPRLPARSRINVMISSSYRPAATGTVPLDARATVSRLDFELQTELDPEQISGRINADVTLALSPRWHVGAEATLHRTTEPLGLPTADESIGRTVFLTQLVERVSRQPDGALFGGITLGDGRVGSLTGRVEASAGVAYRRAQADGAFRATAAQPRPSPFRANTVRGYVVDQTDVVPYARVAYDWFATPVTSFTVRATWAPQPDLVVTEQRIRVEIGRNFWEAVQPEHRIEFPAWSLSFGLRTHL